MANELPTMKRTDTTLKVIGWVSYDDDNSIFPDVDCLDDDVYLAVADEVREKGYLFGGETHQDGWGCCPVLNNGHKACFSCRGWGLVIAVAYDIRSSDGHYDTMVGYMDMMINPKSRKEPDGGVNYSQLFPGKERKHCAVFSAPSLDCYSYNRYIIMPYDKSMDGLEQFDYLDMRCKTPGMEQCVEEYCILKTYRAQTFEEVYALVESDNMFLDPDDMGSWSTKVWPERFTLDELMEKLHADYPDETLTDGVVCFRVGQDDYD